MADEIENTLDLNGPFMFDTDIKSDSHKSSVENNMIEDSLNQMSDVTVGQAREDYDDYGVMFNAKPSTTIDRKVENDTLNDSINLSDTDNTNSEQQLSFDQLLDNHDLSLEENDFNYNDDHASSAYDDITQDSDAKPISQELRTAINHPKYDDNNDNLFNLIDSMYQIDDKEDV